MVSFISYESHVQFFDQSVEQELTLSLDEEADLEAGNVEKPQHIEGGQIDATQEFEGGNEVRLIFHPEYVSTVQVFEMSGF